MKKKSTVKKAQIKKTVSAKKPSRPLKKVAKVAKAVKPAGSVTHVYGAIKVAIIKFKQPVRVGAMISIRGNHKDVDQKIVSMQYDHKPIAAAKKGQEVGIKVAKKVKDGDDVFII
jgi:hypothetical protein